MVFASDDQQRSDRWAYAITSMLRGSLGQAIGHKAVIGANKAVIPSPPAAPLPLSIDGRRIRT
jgi:hypothetical protein